jgi:hypothetical protein
MATMKMTHGVLMTLLAGGVLSVAAQSVGFAASTSSGITINELMASNGGLVPNPWKESTTTPGTYDKDKNALPEYDDWIELFNAERATVDLGGCYLTDDSAVPHKWQIPAGTMINPLQCLQIWADGKVVANKFTTYGLHASFKLNSSGGRVYLFGPDGTTLLDSVKYGLQSVRVSYGRYPNATGSWGYMLTPTPGAANNQTTRIDGQLPEVTFSQERGFYEAPFDLSLTCSTSDAAIYYTLDGREPYDLITRTPTGTLYAGPIPITTTTCVRACAVKANWFASPMAAHTYIFLEDVRNQATNPATGAQVVPAGCPTTWPSASGSYTSGAAAGDYQVDPDVVALNHRDKFSGLYTQSFKDDMKSVPSVSLFMNKDDWFGTTGIYINKGQDGTERACSLEWIDPNGQESFQANCAVAMQGGVSGGGTSLSRWKILKLSVRPRFKTVLDNGKPTGGPAQLNHRIFRDSPTEVFDTFVLDSLLANTWNHQDSTQNSHPNYLEDQFTCDLHNAMGGPSPHGRYVHVYINGMYWGLYCLHERPDHSWAAQTLGGDKEEYDVLKHGTSMVVNSGVGGKGATANFNAMLAAANAVAADPTNSAKYNTLCQMLDVDNFITCLLAHWYALNSDWPDKNWYATHRVPDGLWRFHVWDAEHALEYWLGGDVRGKSEGGIHDKLKANAEYRMRFADLTHKFLFNNGVLSGSPTADLYRLRIAEIDRAIVGESARWGDTRRSTPGTRQDWVGVEDGVLSKFIEFGDPSGSVGKSNNKPRRDFVLDWLKANNLYPNVDAPVFSIDGVYQHGGHVSTDAALSMQATAGTIWYTLDGTDPRMASGGVSPTAAKYARPVTLSTSGTVKARVLSGTTWSALNEATYAIGPVAESLRVSEIMYHPIDNGDPKDPNMEYIELTNIGSASISLNLVRFTQGVDFVFPDIVLAPKACTLVVKDVAAFVGRYGVDLPIAGQYTGSLSNAGERIELQDAAGRTIVDFTYSDDWYDLTDGMGYSLTVKNPAVTDPNSLSNKDSWRLSEVGGGSPGYDDSSPLLQE